MEQAKIQYVKKERLNLTIYRSNTKMINFEYIATGNTKEHNPYQTEILYNPYRLLTIGGSAPGKKNSR